MHVLVNPDAAPALAPASVKYHRRNICSPCFVQVRIHVVADNLEVVVVDEYSEDMTRWQNPQQDQYTVEQIPLLPAHSR